MADRLFITAARLREVLHYNPETGWFTWRVRLGQRCRIGARAGSQMRNSRRPYRALQVDGRLYHEHNLVWLYMTGDWPTNELDHANNDAADNRWENLRPATRAQNMQNTRRFINNTSGYKGVTLHRARYDACIQVNGKRIHIGSFKTPEEANAAIVKRRSELHGAFCNHG
jgi:hypothetical protein